MKHVPSPYNLIFAYVLDHQHTKKKLYFGIDIKIIPLIVISIFIKFVALKQISNENE